MGTYQNLLAFVQDLQDFLRSHPQMKERLVDMVESYRMCRQRQYGDVHPDVTLGPSCDVMYDHVYKNQGGCSWCRARVESLERIKVSESAQIIEQIIQGLPPERF